MKKKLLLLLVFVFTLSACGSTTENTETEEKANSTIDNASIEDLKAEIESLENENEELRAEIQRLEKEQSSVEVVDSAASEEEATNEDSSSREEEVYGLGDTWTVDGQWTLTLDSVDVTDDRNEFSEKEPAEVVIITYSYENLGYEGDLQDLFLVPETVIDGSGELAETYPANITTYAQDTPVGAKTVGAEEAYGLNNESDTIKIIFKKYDMNSNIQEATFEVPVNK